MDYIKDKYWMVLVSLCFGLLLREPLPENYYVDNEQFLHPALAFMYFAELELVKVIL